MSLKSIELLSAPSTYQHKQDAQTWDDMRTSPLLCLCTNSVREGGLVWHNPTPIQTQLGCISQVSQPHNCHSSCTSPAALQAHHAMPLPHCLGTLRHHNMQVPAHPTAHCPCCHPMPLQCACSCCYPHPLVLIY